MEFAKLYQSDEFGQILVKRDSDEDGSPEIRFYFVPDGLGVCSFAIGYTDNDDGWDSCGDAFENKVDQAFAEKCVGAALEQSGLS